MSADVVALLRSRQPEVASMRRAPLAVRMPANMVL